MKYAANLTMMFNEHPFMERFGAAAKAGFSAVEYLFPYDFSAEDIAEQLQLHNLEQVLFNTPAGDFAGGERGLAALPGRSDEFLAGVEQALHYAKVLNCPRVHAMAGLLPSEQQRDEYRQHYLDNLKQAAQLCEAAGKQLLIEPINNINIPHYFLNDFGMALEVIDTLKESQAQVQLQFDLFHCQRIHGDVPQWLQRCAAYTTHFQIAGTPDRHEPNIGDLPVEAIYSAIKQLNLQHLHVGCEYIPAAETVAGLGWMQQY